MFLAHGYVGDGRSTWRRQLDGLCDEFTVVAWDAPGAGGSSDPPESFGVAGYADCLAAFMAALGFPRAHVVGLSFGGALALALSDRHPDAAKTLVLVSAYAGWSGSLPADVAEARLQQAFRLSELSADEYVATLLPTMFASPVPEDDMERFRAAMTAFHPVGFRAMSRASAEDLSDVPRRISVPALLVYGDRDERCPMAVATALQAEIGGAKLKTLPGVGHVCNIEAADQFNEVVRRFLADHRD